MYFKTLGYSFCVALALISRSSAGIIPQHHEKEHHEIHEIPKHHSEHHELHELAAHHPEHHEKATSYMNFQGPVVGPAFEVKVPYIEPHHHDHHDHHHKPEIKYVHDYVALPKYEFSYGVEDHHTGDFHSQKEKHDGHGVTGEYSVAEPGGRLRIVTYRADKDGFHAEVHTSGKNDHSGYHHKEHHPHFAPHESNHLGAQSAPVEVQAHQAPEPAESHKKHHFDQYSNLLSFFQNNE